MPSPAFPKFRVARCALLALTALSCCAGSAWAQSRYTYVDLGAAWSGRSTAAALNDLGQVVGTASNDLQGTNPVAYVWSAGTTTVLPHLAGGRGSSAAGINNSGDVVGYSNVGYGSQAVLWRGGAASALSPSGTHVLGYAFDINDAGQITGGFQNRSSPLDPGRPQAAMWSSAGSMTMLTSGYATSMGLAVNGSGQMAGYVGNFGGSNHDPANSLPATWSPGLRTYPEAGYWGAQANDINDLGQVVGTSGNGLGPDQPLLWDGTQTVALQVLGYGAIALGLNERTEIVGTSWGGTAGNSWTSATLWIRGAAYDLNTLIDPGALPAGWTLTSATDVNEQGWIVGYARQTETQVTRAFLLTPVPEAGSAAMMTLGLAVLASAIRARRRRAAAFLNRHRLGIRASATRWALITGLSFSATAAVAETRYNYVDLSALLPAGSVSSAAAALNDSGQIVGSMVSGGTLHAVVWSSGGITLLPQLPGSSGSRAAGINNAGDVVGQAIESGPSTRAVVWRGGVATALSPAGNLFTGYAQDINDAGQVTGGFQNRGPTDPNRPQAVAWDAGGAMSMLASGFQTSSGSAINSAGVVVGFVGNYSGTPQQGLPPNSLPATWSPALTTQPVTGLWEAQAHDINDRGQVVGTAGWGPGYADRPMLWDGGAAVPLPTLGAGGVALALNEHTDIVGYSAVNNDPGSSARTFATLWSGGTAVDLNTLIPPGSLGGGWVLSRATDINEAGWIVGEASYMGGSGLTRAFLLTPVPEPATSAMLLTGVVALVWRMHRRRSAPSM